MFSPIQVLFIEDNPGDARLVKEMLSETGLIRLSKWLKNLGGGLHFLNAEGSGFVSVSEPGGGNDR